MGEMVHVPYGDDMSKTATLLLAAVEELDGVEPGVVTVDHFTDSFVAPEEVVKKAGLDTHDPDADFGEEVKAAQKAAETKAGQSGDLLSVDGHEQEVAASEEAPAAKKTAAKKTAAKKTAKKS